MTMTAMTTTFPSLEPSRRGFLQAMGGVGVGLVVGFGEAHAQGRPAIGARMNPFLRIEPGGAIIVVSSKSELGQGSPTALAMAVAEELDADWSKVSYEFSPANGAVYNHALVPGIQITAGSSSISTSLKQYREAGAAARQMLIQAAAQRWRIAPAAISIVGGELAATDGRRLSFGAVAEAAARIAPPAEIKLKDPAEFRLIGKSSVKRLDAGEKARGRAVYTQDFTLPGMLYAAVAHAPRFGGKVRAFDAARARAVRSVVDVVRIPQGVAVLASNTWAAFQGRDALAVQWDDSEAETRSSADITREYKALLDKPGLVAVSKGDTTASLRSAARIVEADFEFPFLAHSALEPMNAVVAYRPGERLDVWTGAQMQSEDRKNAAGVVGLDIARVAVNTLHVGGSFGRRASQNSDYIVEAVEIAKAIGGRAPVKLVWSREDDMRAGHYRPVYLHRIRAGLDARGRIVGWEQRIVGQAVQEFSPFRPFLINKDGVDVTSVEGASNLPYATEALQVDLHSPILKLPILWWRSVGSSHTAFSTEVVLDWLAREAGKDPLAFRLEHLEAHPRHQRALRVAAAEAGWSTPAPAGLHRGIAVHECFGTVIAQVAEISFNPDGKVKVERVTCSVDCGLAVMPDQIVAQVEGGIGYGLSAALREAITLNNGSSDQSQFSDYEVLRMDDMPRIDVHIIPSDAPIGGVGEPPTPVIAPAVANAIFAARGARITTLPLRASGFA